MSTNFAGLLARFVAALRRLRPHRPRRSARATAPERPLAWRPHELGDRLARRARRERAAGGHREATRSAGEALCRRYGEDFYSAIGARGGSTVLEERGVEYLQDIGARGGAVTRQRYGPEHYAEIGRKGGQAGRGGKRPRRQPNQLELPL